MTCADHIFTRDIFSVTAEIRSRGHSAAFNYGLVLGLGRPDEAPSLSKQLKNASTQNAAKCVIIGQEYLDGERLIVKDMSTGEQTVVSKEAFLAGLDGT